MQTYIYIYTHGGWQYREREREREREIYIYIYMYTYRYMPVNPVGPCVETSAIQVMICAVVMGMASMEASELAELETSTFFGTGAWLFVRESGLDAHRCC